ncbi:hypothetical protein [Kineococcus radiotolerans]|uniref:Uncharacterized protein n=1 Tax=Kineococcus radiotolerans (strain ATCC BAA-149 / DSM 14245 / SRS30216) TaxID=266940 RepID=A6WBW4_KINRD|nr:hypothetical protein [Kineococcus radiotolerans]ABS04303.1 hypothetical protein Krad_2835 [Kineococcus radiotolerans SRS30216 = ATCC BAA-149]
MILEDLLWMVLAVTPPAGDNVFTDPDLLVESSLVSVHLDALGNQVAALIDLRTCPSFGLADTAVLLARGVTSPTWEAERRSPGFTAWTILGFEVDEVDPGEAHGNGVAEAESAVRLQLHCHTDTSSTVLATGAFFVTGAVPGIGPGQPDHGDDSATVRAGVAGWTSPFTVAQVQQLRR